ncbi:MAG: hypothetical protein ACTHVE_08275 [Senegalia sp. (in: firmicutes)]|uniref:hypothetical protein n=2 Tax=Senegalia sp. (in: firmicutes) TaxID=1924098 RepID=UPI003F97BB54
MTREFKIAMLGFGSAGKAFAKLLMDKHEEILEKYECDTKVVAISTNSRGSMVDEAGIDLESTLSDIENLNKFNEKRKCYSKLNSMEIAKTVNYDVIMELTPLQIFTGQPAIDHIKIALNRKKHAITANKGPIAWAYEELRELAKKQNSLFYYETTVMDGTPVFNLVEETLDLCKVTQVNGILNSTTNFILEEIAEGKAYDDVMVEGKKRGFIEADPAMDIEGWDAAAKTAVLLNVLMDANINPSDIDRRGIEDITKEQIEDAEKRGNIIKLICHGSIKNGEIIGKVEPKEISKDHIYANIKGTSSVVTISTDLMRDLTIVEHDPEIEQTAYGVFSDLLRVIKNRI